MKMKVIDAFFYSIVLQYVISFNGNNKFKQIISKSIKTQNNLIMLNDNSDAGADKFKIVTPDNIASLFNTDNIPKKKIVPNNDIFNDEKEEDFIDLEDEEYLYMDLDETKELLSDAKKSIQEAEYVVNENVMKPLSTFINSYDDEIIEESNDNSSNNPTELNDIENEYSNLSGSLDKNQLRQARAALTMYDSFNYLNDSITARRVFKIDPTEIDRADRMQYGAYRRWKVPELEASSNTVTKPRTSKLGDAGGNNKSKRKPAGGTSGGVNKKGKNNGGTSGLTSDNFYNAIKNLGSGPVEKGSSQGTGVAEPPPGMRNIRPKKAPSRNSKKKVITPSDIDSLFSRQQQQQQKNEDNDDDDEDNEDEENEVEEDDNNNSYTNQNKIESSNSEDNILLEQNDSSSTTTTAAAMTSTFNPMIGPNEEIPQWLIDADKEAKKKNKAMKNRKKKKLTDDWRFWAAIVGGIGFISAFINVYQQTGGFGSGDFIHGSSISGDEMII